MERMLKVKLSNVLRAEAKKTMEEEKDLMVKKEKLGDIFTLQEIVKNYDELKPLINERIEEIKRKEKWEER